MIKQEIGTVGSSLLFAPIFFLSVKDLGLSCEMSLVLSLCIYVFFYILLDRLITLDLSSFLTGQHDADQYTSQEDCRV